MKLADLPVRFVNNLGEQEHRGKDRKPRVITPEKRREYGLRFKKNNPESYRRLMERQNTKRAIRDAERHIEKLRAKLDALRVKLEGLA